MANLTPTLELVITSADVADLAKQGMTVREAEVATAASLRNLPLQSGVSFSAPRICVVDGNYFVENFSALVASIFDKDGVTYLKFTTGDLVALRYIIQD